MASAGSFARVVVSKHGAADVLRYEADGGDAAALQASLGPKQLLVDNKFAGVNFIDTYFRSGLYPKEPPFTNGQEGAGVVLAVGSDLDSALVGKKLGFWGAASGSYAARVVCDEASTTVLPDDADLKLAAATLLQGLTSHYLVHDSYRVKKGDYVLVHAAAGGCGLLISQMCKNLGATVIGTCSTQEKAELARKVGRCDEVLLYSKDADFSEAVKRIVPSGVHVVFDGVGKDTFQGSLKSLRIRGTLVSFGNASGAVPPVSPLELTKNGSLFLTRPTLAHYVCDPAERAQRTSDVMRWLGDGSLTATIGLTAPLSDARAAQEALEGRRTTGKVVLEI